MESDRLSMWDRRENLASKPAHHFSNRGGVLFEKQFVGFEKYYQNDEALMTWYKRAYPKQFVGHGEEH